MKKVSIGDMYDILNGETNASYIEHEGNETIRADFSDGSSVWFRDYGPDDRVVEGNLAPTVAKVINKIAKRCGFKSVINS